MPDNPFDDYYSKQAHFFIFVVFPFSVHRTANQDLINLAGTLIINLLPKFRSTPQVARTIILQIDQYN